MTIRAKGYVASAELAERVVKGDLTAIARLISRVEAELGEARDAIGALQAHAGKAHVIGLTGVPGSGKSTLVARLASLWRKEGAKVGIVAVDPTSPYSGGSILGDRIRMAELFADPGVFVRSMATRGALGGLARTSLDVVDILDAGGFDVIIIETVGVGQDEVDIARASHTTVVVSAPGLGDEVQAIKAGIIEIADIHVVSKCDRSDSLRTLTDLKGMMTLGRIADGARAWTVPVIGTSAVTGEGLDALGAAIAAHRQALAETALGAERRRAIAAFRLTKTAEAILLERLARTSEGAVSGLAACLARREANPYALAAELAEKSLRTERG